MMPRHDARRRARRRKAAAAFSVAWALGAGHLGFPERAVTSATSTGAGRVFPEAGRPDAHLQVPALLCRATGGNDGRAVLASRLVTSSPRFPLRRLPTRSRRCSRSVFGEGAGPAEFAAGSLAAAVAGWSVYDWALRRSLQKPYLEMRVVDAAVNGKEEDLADRITELLEAAPSSAAEDSVAVWERLRGADATGTGPYAFESESLRCKEEASGWVVEGKAAGEPLAKLLTRRWPESGGVVSDTASRLDWERVIREASSPVNPETIRGSSWTFEFRSYTNEEELGAMLAARGGLQGLLFRARDRTTLEVSDDGSAILEDNFLLLGGAFTARIRWRGSLASEGGVPRLQWTSSEAAIFFAVFPVPYVVNRPSAAERLRKDPWELQAMLTAPVDGQERNLMVMKRLGQGCLVFMEDNSSRAKG
ncbi:naa50 [Symbiodinium sp. CCMP2456]|nr:naa50 [Symbiodinium sp. CCMP2456]